MNIEFSFVIPFKSSIGSLSLVLESLKKIPQSEIIIVDDCSGIDLSSISSSYDFTIIINEQCCGAAFSRNKGASKAIGEYVVFIDSDIVLTKKGHERLRENYKKSFNCFQGIYSSDCHDDGFFSNFYNLRIRKGYMSEKEFTNNCITCFFAIKKSVFEKTVGFDSSIQGASTEDTEYGLHLKTLGIDIYQDKELELLHLKKHDLSSLFENDIYRTWDWSKILFRNISFKELFFGDGFDHASSSLIKATICSSLYFLVPLMGMTFFLCVLLLQLFLLRSYLQFFKQAKGSLFAFLSYLFFIVDLFVVFVVAGCSFLDTFVLKSTMRKSISHLLKEDLPLKLRIPLLINFILPFVFKKQVRDIFNYLNLFSHEGKGQSRKFKSVSNFEEIYDVIVIGAGVGGLSVASKLKESVLVIEEGDLDDTIGDDIFCRENLKNKFRKFGLDFTISTGPMAYYEVRGFGGASSINSGICSLPDFCNDDHKKIAQLSSDVVQPSVLDTFFFDSFKNSTSVKTAMSSQFKTRSRTGNIFKIEDFSILNERVNSISKSNDLWSVEMNSRSLSARKIVVSAGVFQTPNLLKRSKILNHSYGVYFHPLIKVRIRFKEDFKFDCEELNHFQIRNEEFHISMGHSNSKIKKGYEKLFDIDLDQQDVFLSIMIKDEVPAPVYYSELLSENFVFHHLRVKEWEKFTNGLSLLKKLYSEHQVQSIDILTHEGLLELNTFEFSAKALKNSRPVINSVHAMGTMYSFDEKFEFLNKLEENGLYISDASVLPGAVGTNPQLAIMSLAEKQARKLKESLFEK